MYLQYIYNYIYVQNDFVSGSLAVPGAEDILDMVEDLSKLDIWYQVFYTQVTGYLYVVISTMDNEYLSRTGTLLTTSPSSPTWGCGSWTPPGSASTTPTWPTSACSTRWISTNIYTIYLHNIFRSCSRGILPTDRSCGQITAFRAQTVGVNVANMQKIFIIY